MSGRKKKPVTLAGSSKRVVTHLIPENGPTPERLRQAGIPVTVQPGTLRTQIVGHGEIIGASGVVRISQAPLDRLHARGRLDDDPARNGQLFEAGNKLRGHYFLAGLSGFAANDLNGTGGSSPSNRMPITETMESNRRSLRLARAAMHPGDWLVVNAVVCLEADLMDAGFNAGCTNADAANAVALDRLRRGLATLAELWGYSQTGRTTPKLATNKFCSNRDSNLTLRSTRSD